MYAETHALHWRDVVAQCDATLTKYAGLSAAPIGLRVILCFVIELES